VILIFYCAFENKYKAIGIEEMKSLVEKASTAMQPMKGSRLQKNFLVEFLT